MSADLARQSDLQLPAVAEAPAALTLWPGEITPEWVPVTDLVDVTSGGGSYAEKQARKRAAEIRRETRGAAARINRQGGGAGRWFVRRDQAWLDGETVADVWRRRHLRTVAAPSVKPPGWDEADDYDRDRHIIAEHARRGWLAEWPELTQEQRLPLWQARYGEQLRKHGVGTSIGTARRLQAWKPAERMWCDGRRTRSGKAVEPGSDGFRSYLAHVFLRVYRGNRRAFKAAWETASGWAAEHGEEPASYAACLTWVNRTYSESVRDYYHNEQRWLRTRVEGVRKDRSNFRPAEWWSGDWHLCDFEIMHNGQVRRPWLAVWQCMYSGLIVSWVLALRPNSEELILSFGDGVIKYGAPAHLLIDNGKDYRSHGLTGGKRLQRDDPKVLRAIGKNLKAHHVERISSVCEETGTTPHFAMPFNPGPKTPERFFADGAVGLAMPFHVCGAFVGNSPADRPEASKRRGATRPTLESAREMVGTYIEKIHNQSARKQLNNRSPLEAFFQDDPIAMRTAPEHVVRFKLAPRRLATVGRGGTVQLDGVLYGQDSVKSSDKLFKLQGEQVQLRYDRDRSRVFVCEAQTGKLICEARNARLLGRTSEDVRELRSRQKAARKIVREALPAARFANQALDVAAMLEYRAQYHTDQAEVRKAAGAESCSRNYQLLPGAGELLDELPALPGPKSGGSRATDDADPLDSGPTPTLSTMRIMDDPIDEEDAPDVTWEGGLVDDRDDDVTFVQTEPPDVEDDDVLMLPELGGVGNEIDSAGERDD